ncbi:hypothetical protein LX32DRAFT_648978 [Colletotrichum zoysiae]|uniref:Yeast cell wall synthesis Kre9/Knh1-like N-terminal domain-containing protein n=1 Tax=Colletotrichum zoysiae TaxID=1216348 RepID=A0AAD9HRK7_9PEZI|nr:hypothetical protein LX32DRAFT_648978 [Colletotrichum zoysiae]
MFSKATIAITSLLALAEAVKVTEPAKGDDWDLSKTNEITWDTVSSDPKTFEIVIVNQSSYPGVSQTIAKVNAADGKYELKDLKVAPGGSYRINLVSTDPQNSGILAQSEEFSLTGSDDSSSAPASASATASASASGSASASATGSSSGSTATGSVTQTASGLTTVTTGSATATASDASSSGAATGTASRSAASGSSTAAPNSASGIKSTFAILGSVAVAAYMLF